MSAITRRSLVAAGMGVPFLANVAHADPLLANRKLVVIVCRGGLDGLSLAPPVGDPEYAGLRGPLAVGGALSLDNTFGLHPALTAIHALANAGHARIAPAVASPDRARSHFEAQDVLETGAAATYAASSGWLNRTVAALSVRREVKALSIGATAPLILRGPAPVGAWSPGRGVDTAARLPALLQDLYRDDPLLGPALARGLETEDMAQAAVAEVRGMVPGRPGAGGAPGRTAARSLGQAISGFLRETGGPQIIAVSVDGFDTHANQGAAQGQLAQRLSGLDGLVEGLHTGLGADWRDTAVLAITEFGRTARANGTGGTDHGTASAALVLGGALKPGGIVGDWPTLKRPALFEDRDLAPTLDVRALAKGLLAEHFGIDRRTLDTTIFPDSANVRGVTGLI